MVLYNCGGRSEGMSYNFFPPLLRISICRLAVCGSSESGSILSRCKGSNNLTAFWTRHMTETVFENRQPVSRRDNVVLTFLKVSSVITGVLLWCIGGKKVDIRCKEGKRSGFLFQCACANFSSSNENPG